MKRSLPRRARSHYRAALPLPGDAEWKLPDAWWQGRAETNTRTVHHGCHYRAAANSRSVPPVTGVDRRRV